MDKSYPGDNRLISPKSPHRRGGLAPRCRLITSWGCIRSQGLGCSPIKAARELGSERRETVRSSYGYAIHSDLVTDDVEAYLANYDYRLPFASFFCWLSQHDVHYSFSNIITC